MMATNLYETLEIPPDASQEQIRKAYKRMALITHPDRLPPTASQSDKQASEEQFREVNNAYEILNNPQNRELYDQHGVWPPPEPEYDRPSSHRSPHQYRSPPRRGTYPEPFYHHDFHFTDPFILFNSIFGQFNRGFGGHSHFDSPSARFHSHFGDLFAALERDPFPDFGPAFPSRPLFPPPFLAFPSIAWAPPSGRGGSGFASEGFFSQTINGVTHTVHKRRDWDGTEHEYRTYPDGREVHLINGMEQRTANSFLPPPPPRSARHSSSLPATDPMHRLTDNDNRSPSAVDPMRRLNDGDSRSPPPPYHPRSTRGFVPPHPEEFQSSYNTRHAPASANHEDKWYRRSRTRSDAPASPSFHHNDGSHVPYTDDQYGRNDQYEKRSHWWHQR